MDPATISIASSASASYLFPLAAMLRSLVNHLNPRCSIEAYVIDAGMPDTEKRRLEQSFASDRVQIHWCQVDESRLKGLPCWGGMGPATYYRLLLPDVLPASTNRVLWLDADVIVLGDIAEIWTTPFDGSALLAAQDMMVPYIGSAFGVKRHRMLELPPNAPYFNAGMMCIDLEWWRRNNVPEAVLSYLRRHSRSVYYYDQDGLNAILCGKWRRVECRWNVIASVAGRRFYNSAHLNPYEYRTAIESPLVVHYGGAMKPWRVPLRGPLFARFYEFLDQTKWQGWRPHYGWKDRLLGFYQGRLRDRFYVFESYRLRLLRFLG